MVATYWAWRKHTRLFDKNSPHPVICLLDEQLNVTQVGGTMRLGSQPARLMPGSVAALAYGAEDIHERHRHRYEFNNDYRTRFEQGGMRFSGTSPDGKLCEVIELPNHPWFVAVQYHPEFKSKPLMAQPLFAGFVRAAIDRHLRRTESSQPMLTGLQSS